MFRVVSFVGWCFVCLFMVFLDCVVLTYRAFGFDVVAAMGSLICMMILRIVIHDPNV